MIREVWHDFIYPYGRDGEPITTPIYEISNFGVVISHLRRSSSGWIYDPNYSRVIKSRKTSVHRSRPHLRVTLCLPADLWDYDYRRSGSKTIRKDFQVHQLVMWAHRPLEDEPFPPAGYPQKEWDEMTVGNKRFLSTYQMIDHCGENCDSFLNVVDPDNRDNDTLRWTTPMENTIRATVQYGGNVANARKLILPQQEIIKPVNNLMEFLV